MGDQRQVQSPVADPQVRRIEADALVAGEERKIEIEIIGFGHLVIYIRYNGYPVIEKIDVYPQILLRSGGPGEIVLGKSIRIAGLNGRVTGIGAGQSIRIVRSIIVIRLVAGL